MRGRDNGGSGSGRREMQSNMNNGQNDYCSCPECGERIAQQNGKCRLDNCPNCGCRMNG